MDYNVKIESELIGDKESLYLSVTHNGGSAWTSIGIVNPDVEIPQIIDVLQRYLTSAMNLDGESDAVYCAGCGFTHRPGKCPDGLNGRR